MTARPQDTFLNPADSESFKRLEHEFTGEVRPLQEEEVERLAKVWSEFDALRKYFHDHPRVLEALRGAHTQQEFKEYFGKLIDLYNRAQHLLTADQHFEKGSLAKILQEDPLWHHLILNKELLLNSDEDVRPLLDILNEYLKPPQTTKDTSRNIDTRARSSGFEKAALHTSKPPAHEKQQDKKTSPKKVKHLFRLLLSSLVLLGVTHASVLKESKDKPISADAIAENVLKKTLKEPLQQKPNEVAATPQATPTPTLPPQLQSIIQQSDEREKLQKQAKAEATPSPASTLRPTPTATTQKSPTATPTPAKTAAPSLLQQKIEEKMLSMMAQKFEIPATMDGLSLPEDFRKTHAYISPAADFVAMLVPSKEDPTWETVPNESSAQELYTVEQHFFMEGYVGHVLGTRPANFTTLDGDTVDLEVQRDQNNNYRVVFRGEPQPLRYTLVEEQERGQPYILRPRKTMQWSPQTEQILASLKDKDPALQVETLRAYIVENGRYSQKKEHFEKYAKDMLMRDKHMIMDCDVANELLRKYLDELGFNVGDVGGYQDTNKDGSLVAAELHGIARVVLPDGRIIFPDASPRRMFDKEQAQHLAKNKQDVHNPLLDPTFADKEDAELMTTGFEKAIKSLWDTVIPLPDAEKQQVYVSLLKKLEADMMNINDNNAYLYDWVYKDMLIHGWGVGPYPEAVYRRISAPEAIKKAALSQVFRSNGKTFSMSFPVSGATHLLPQGHLPYVRSVYHIHTMDDRAYKTGWTPIMLHPNFIKEGVKIWSIHGGHRTEDGRYYAFLSVDKSPKERFRALWYKDHLIYLYKEERDNGSDGNYMHVMRDLDTGKEEVITNLDTKDKKTHFELNGKTLAIPAPQGKEITFLKEGTLKGGKFSGVVSLMTIKDKEFEDALCKDNVLVPTYEGAVLEVVRLKENPFVLFTLDRKRMGFMPENHLITQVSVNGKTENILYLEVLQGTLYWISEGGTWGIYAEGVLQPLGTLSSLPVLDVEIPGRLDKEKGPSPFLWNGRLYTSVPIGGKDVPIRNTRPMGKHRVFSSQEGSGLLMEDGTIVDRILGMTPRSLSMECLDDACTRAVGAMQDHQEHVVVFEWANGAFKQVFVSKEPVLSINDNEVWKSKKHGYISVNLSATDKGIIPLRWSDKQIYVEGLWNVKDYNLSGALNTVGTYPAYVFHHDGTMSFMHDSDSMLHNIAFMKAKDLADVFKKRFPGKKVPAELQGLKPKYVHEFVPYGEGYQKAALLGKAEGEDGISKHFVLTSDDMLTFEDNDTDGRVGLARKPDGTLVIWENALDQVSAPEIFTMKNHKKEPLHIVDKPLRTIQDIVFSDNPKSNAIVIVGQESEGAGAHPVVVWKKGEQEQAISVIEYQFNKKRVHNHMGEGVYVSLLPDDTPKIQADQALKSDREIYTYVYGKWYADSAKDRDEVDLVEELRELMPPTKRLTLPQDTLKPSKIAEDILVLIRSGASLDMNKEEVAALLRRLQAADFRYLRKQLLTEDKEAKKTYTEFMQRYLVPKQWMLSEEPASDYVERSTLEDFEQQFSEGFQNYVEDRAGY